MRVGDGWVWPYRFLVLSEGGVDDTHVEQYLAGVGDFLELGEGVVELVVVITSEGGDPSLDLLRLRVSLRQASSGTSQGWPGHRPVSIGAVDSPASGTSSPPWRTRCRRGGGGSTGASAPVRGGSTGRKRSREARRSGSGSGCSREMLLGCPACRSGWTKELRPRGACVAYKFQG